LTEVVQDCFLQRYMKCRRGVAMRFWPSVCPSVTRELWQN